MKRRFIRLLARVALLTLAVIVVVLLHRQVQKEAKEREAAGKKPDAAAEALEGGEWESAAVLRMGDGVSLGRIEANPEGGVRIIVPGEADSEETVYTFTDVTADSWYANAVNFAVSAGLMTGIGDEPLFQPEYGMLRESFASILYRFAHGEREEPRYRFDDVPEDSWFYEPVCWVTNRRLMSGTSSASFGAGEYMTCEQALVGLYRLAGSPRTDGSLAEYPYASKVTDGARGAVDWAWKNGLITEVECVWYPTQAVSRAQIALLLMRYSMLPE